MLGFGSGVGLWEPSEQWRRKHRQSRVYEVRVAVEPVVALDRAWQEVLREHDGDAAKILDGGAVLRRLEPGLVAVVSGGEDAFDSLAWSINVTLGEAVQKVAPDAMMRVVHQERVDER
ncbi:hypothetical protein ACTQ49_02620 [Luteococcus sp. Sow4_B9]|uniref:hypothetical protein n=1 Tax=Luteococcus sp. Sow4_B9 TaxID=3438792 RepID=UPI003F9A8AF6